MSWIAKVKDKLSGALYCPSLPDSNLGDESTEVWLRRSQCRPLPKKPLGKRIAHFFLCHHIHAIREYKGQGHFQSTAIERIDWGNTILAWSGISIVILLCVLA